MTRVIPQPTIRHDIDSADGLAWLENEYAPPEGGYVRLNMITSLTGTASGSDGTSETLSSPVDRRILGVIRAASDVVVVGAATVRAERYIAPRRTRLAIVTSTGDLGDVSFAEEDRDRVVLVADTTHASAVERAGSALGIDTVVADAAELSPAAILTALATRDWTRVVCEGGPSLAGQFAEARCIDEFCLSLAPQFTPPGTPLLGHAADIRLAPPHAMLVDDAGFSYLRSRPHA
ncbi:dihydrofolate reductase family protein [Microbacterium sp. NPDC089189]|uniref:dihydrofolate reductase family protein n=1 Tax=Microbacterium sp. NPDC089189 TaxID=3154972 RepID=UPI00341205D1